MKCFLLMRETVERKNGVWVCLYSSLLLLTLAWKKQIIIIMYVLLLLLLLLYHQYDVKRKWGTFYTQMFGKDQRCQPCLDSPFSLEEFNKDLINFIRNIHQRFIVIFLLIFFFITFTILSSLLIIFNVLSVICLETWFSNSILI